MTGNHVESSGDCSGRECSGYLGGLKGYPAGSWLVEQICFYFYISIFNRTDVPWDRQSR